MHLIRSLSCVGLVFLIGALAGAPSLEGSDGLPWRLTKVETMAGAGRISLAFGPDGQPAMAYDEFVVPVHRGLRFARFNGTSWNAGMVDPPDAGGGALAFGPDGQPALAYFKGDNLVFARFDGTAWGPAATISGGWSFLARLRGFGGEKIISRCK